jgi:YD repeat-containing protein
MLTFSYDGSRRVTQVGDGTRVVSYSYTGDLLTGVTDAEGHIWTYVYQTTGQRAPERPGFHPLPRLHEQRRAESKP